MAYLMARLEPKLGTDAEMPARYYPRPLLQLGTNRCNNNNTRVTFTIKASGKIISFPIGGKTMKMLVILLLEERNMPRTLLSQAIDIINLIYYLSLRIYTRHIAKEYLSINNEAGLLEWKSLHVPTCTQPASKRGRS